MSRSITLAFVGLALLFAISLLSAQQNTPNPPMGMGTSQPMMSGGMPMGGGMQEMHDKFLNEIFTHVEAADTALAANDAAKAKAELGQAKSMIAQWRQMGSHHPAASMSANKLSNTKCPIMLIPVSEPVRPELTRMFKGSMVGFCCASCLTQWDKLSDAEKEAKLKAAGWNPAS
jgi:hypothetical protein